jgi:hypothetical protein
MKKHQKTLKNHPEIDMVFPVAEPMGKTRLD